MFDIGNVTLDELDKEYDKTLAKLSRLSALRVALSAEENARVKKLIEEYQALMKEEKE